MYSGPSVAAVFKKDIQLVGRAMSPGTEENVGFFACDYHSQSGSDDLNGTLGALGILNR